MGRLFFVFALLASAVAAACPVCGANSTNEREYQVMTLIMSLLPLLTMGSIVGFVVYRVRQADRDEKKAEEKKSDDADGPKP